MSTTQLLGNWPAFREKMPVTRKWSYFDNAAVAPLPSPSQAAIQQWLTQAVEEGDTCWSQWVRLIERTRTAAATLLHADPTEVALVTNTTTGINIVAEGFPWQAGDNVVILENEFPTNQYPWLNLTWRGVQTRRVTVVDGKVDLQRLAEAIDQKTRIVSVSWVGFASGWRLDLNDVVELAHARDALLFVDAIQGLGVFPIDVRATPIDFLAADGHKWLLGPEGAGLLYIRRDHLERLRPVGTGWNSVVQGNDYSRIELNLKSSAARYEGGSHNMVGLIGLGASLELLLSLGLGSSQSTIADRVLELTDLACQQLQELGARILSERRAPHSSGIVSFEFPGQDPQTLRRKCLSEHVVLACRSGKLRISPHAYANEDDIGRMIAVVRDSV